MPLEASILITTKNRREDLRRAVASCLLQEGAIEVLVIDDGSDDGTSDMVRAEFPSVRVVRHEQSMGYIHRRNEGAALALAPVLFSIDDDGAYTDPRTIRHTLAEMGAHPRIGAVAMPHIDVQFSQKVIQQAPDGEHIWCAAHYRGTAHALRRDLFLALGGYKRQLVHQNEEPEYCMRMLAAGSFTRLGTAPPLHHFESPKRSYARQYRFNARNHVLLPWFNCPLWFLPVQWAASSALQLRNALARGYLWPAISGLAAGYAAIPGQWSARRPAPWPVYKLFRAMRARGGSRLSEIESLLPPLKPAGPPSPALMRELAAELKAGSI